MAQRRLKAKRKAIPKEAETQVLVESRRICALCFGLRANVKTQRQGQIAHLDKDPSNATKDNLVWLCQRDHDAYDSITSQTKNYSEGEVRHYRDRVIEFVRKTLEILPDDRRGRPAQITRVRPGNERAVPPDLFDRRLRIYEAAKELVFKALRTTTVSLEELGQFAVDTDHATFYFDDQLVDYLADLHRHAIHLHVAHEQMKDVGYGPVSQDVINANHAEMVWFSDQITPLRNLFAARMRISHT